MTDYVTIYLQERTMIYGQKDNVKNNECKIQVPNLMSMLDLRHIINKIIGFGLTTRIMRWNMPIIYDNKSRIDLHDCDSFQIVNSFGGQPKLLNLIKNISIEYLDNKCVLFPSCKLVNDKFVLNDTILNFDDDKLTNITLSLDLHASECYTPIITNTNIKIFDMETNKKVKIIDSMVSNNFDRKSRTVDVCVKLDLNVEMNKKYQIIITDIYMSEYDEIEHPTLFYEGELELDFSTSNAIEINL